SSVVPGSLSIFNFTPQQGVPLGTVTISGQGFSPNLSSNAVKMNGVTATVISATATTLVVTIPAAATSGPISVTVGTQTATSSINFTLIPVPSILSVSPTSVLSGSGTTNIPNFQVTGLNLSGATLAFIPTFSPPLVSITS